MRSLGTGLLFATLLILTSGSVILAHDHNCLSESEVQYMNSAVEIANVIVEAHIRAFQVFDNPNRDEWEEADSNGVEYYINIAEPVSSRSLEAVYENVHSLAMLNPPSGLTTHMHVLSLRWATLVGQQIKYLKWSRYYNTYRGLSLLLTPAQIERDPFGSMTEIEIKAAGEAGLDDATSRWLKVSEEIERLSRRFPGSLCVSD